MKRVHILLLFFLASNLAAQNPQGEPRGADRAGSEWPIVAQKVLPIMWANAAPLHVFSSDSIQVRQKRAQQRWTDNQRLVAVLGSCESPDPRLDSLAQLIDLGDGYHLATFRATTSQNLRMVLDIFFPELSDSAFFLVMDNSGARLIWDFLEPVNEHTNRRRAGTNVPMRGLINVAIVYRNYDIRKPTLRLCQYVD